MATKRSIDIVLKAHDRASGVFVKAGGAVKRFSAGVARAAKVVAGFGLALASAATAAVTVMVSRSLKAIDTIAKMSDELEISTEALGGFEHAANISGTNIETLHKAMQIFVRRLGEAKMGLGEGVHGLKTLGFSAEQMIALGTEEGFLRIAEAISRIPTAAERAQAAYSMFGRQGVNLLNMFKGGRKEIELFRQEADKLGITFSRVAAAKVEMANDALTRLKGVLRGIGNTLAIELAPFIDAIAAKLVDMSTAGEGMGAKVSSAFEKAAMSVASTADFMRGLHIVATALSTAVKGLVASLLMLPAMLEEVVGKLVKLSGWKPPQWIQLNLQFARTWHKTLTKDAEDTAAKLTELWDAKSWGDRAKKAFKSIRAAAAENARKIAARPWGGGAGGAQPSDGEGGGQRKDPLVTFAEQVTRSTRTVVERFKDFREKLAKSLAAGLIDKETFERALLQKFREFKTVDPLKVFAEDIRDSTRTALEQYTEFREKLYEAWGKGLIDTETFGRAWRQKMEELAPGEAKERPTVPTDRRYSLAAVERRFLTRAPGQSPADRAMKAADKRIRQGAEQIKIGKDTLRAIREGGRTLQPANLVN